MFEHENGNYLLTETNRMDAILAILQDSCPVHLAWQINNPNDRFRHVISFHLQILNFLKMKQHATDTDVGINSHILKDVCILK